MYPRSMRSVSLIFIVFLFMLPASVSKAADPAPKAAPLATVNIQDARIVSQEGNVLNIAFTLQNRIGAQPGVRYSIKLVSENKQGQSVVDEKVYDETLTLYENVAIKRVVLYSAPLTLSGQYTVLVVSKNDAGFPYGTTVAGKISLVAKDKGVEIGACLLETKGEVKKSGIPLNQTPLIGGATNLDINCSVTNSSSVPVDITPVFETRRASLFGPIAETVSNENLMVHFETKEKKTVTFSVPKAIIPGTQYVKFLLANQEGTSNPIFFSYVTSGTSGTIQNIYLDKTFYEKGEQAQVRVVWASTGEASITAKLASGNGQACAAPLKKELYRVDVPVTTLQFVIEKKCFDPGVTVTLYGKDDIVLDEKFFGNSQGRSGRIPFLPITLFFLVVLFSGLMIKHIKKVRRVPEPQSKVIKDDFSITLKILLPFITIALLGSLVPFSKASADTVHVGNYFYATVNIDQSSYVVGAPIAVTVSMESVAPSGSNDVSLTAATSGNSLATLISTNVAAGNTVYGSTTFNAPSSAGTYGVDFVIGVNEIPLLGGSFNGILGESKTVCVQATQTLYVALPATGFEVGANVYTNSSLSTPAVSEVVVNSAGEMHELINSVIGSYKENC